MAEKSPGPEARVREIRRKTRRRYSSEEKIRFVLEGLKGEESIAELCRREGRRMGAGQSLDPSPPGAMPASRPLRPLAGAMLKKELRVEARQRRAISPAAERLDVRWASDHRWSEIKRETGCR